MSEKKLYLGIDIGTTSLKAAVFDEKGNRVGLRSVDYTLDSDPVTGYIEFDAKKYVDMCVGVIDELSAECGKITALSVDTQGETMILADENGKPLCPAVVWLDNRAVIQAEEVKARFGNKKVYDVTGQPEITAGWPATKLLWFKENKPEIFGKVKKVFLLEDWIIYNLTGNFVTEPSMQSSSVYFDITNMIWWSDMLTFIGIDDSILPKIVSSGTKVGSYKDISVVTGALDQIAGSIGAGVTDERRISEMTGTALAIVIMTDKIPEYNPDSIVPCHVHVGGKYCRLLWSSTAGMCLKWFRNNFAPELSFAELDKEAEKVNLGCDGMTLLPHFCGASMPDYAPNATASFSGVTLSHGRGHFARSIMEAVAFTLRSDLEYANVPENAEIRITGGGASGKLWPQIKADVTGRNLSTVTESETACLGCAIIAAAGIGDFDSVTEAADKFVKPKKVFSPSENDYTEAYNRYLKLNRDYLSK